MSIKPNKVIIPNDYKEIILNKTDGDSFVNTNNSTLGYLDVVTIDLSNLDLSPKMSYVAEVNYICKDGFYEETYGSPEDSVVHKLVEFKIILDKNTASKYRFFRFSLTPKINICNNTEEIRGVPPAGALLGPLISQVLPMRVYMRLNIIIRNSEEDIFTKTFDRSLIEYSGVIEKGQCVFTHDVGNDDKNFKFIFDSLNGTITDEAPDVFGIIATSTTNDQ